jgi:glyoxylase-like metal-dependent hydrolase (beta-lactamase superfamily II)
MNHRIRRSVLTFALLPVLVACEKSTPTNDTRVEPAPAEQPARPAEPNPAMMPASRDTSPAKKLDLKVITGSEDGFLVNSTLVTGERDAVLIDAQFTLADAKKVADAVTSSGKNLTTVYVTHAHPDHYFGFPAIKESFPNARLMALPATIAEIEKTWQAKVKEWQPTYKDKITSKPVIPEPIATNSLDLEGQKLEIVAGQQGDDAQNSYVWIPSLRTAVTGDIVYDGVHPWTAETTPASRKAWSTTLDKLSAMKPDKVIPGHQKADKSSDPANLEFTRTYLAAYDEALAASKNAKDLEAKMKEKYPGAALPVIVKIGAEAAYKPGAKTLGTDKNEARPGGATERAEPGAATPGGTQRTEPGGATPKPGSATPQ